MTFVRGYTPWTEPMEHQSRGLAFLAKRGGGGLLWEPGTGKTKTIVDYMAVLCRAKGRCVALVVAPLSAEDTWPDEVEKHLHPDIPRKVVLLSGNGTEKVKMLRSLEPLEEGLTLVVFNLDVFSHRHTMTGTKTVTVRAAMADAIRDTGFDLGVVDESHRIKGVTSNVSRSMGALSSAFPRRVLLTGTVAPHSPRDVFAQWRWLNPKRFGTRIDRFDERYVRYGGYRNKQVVGFKNRRELNRLMAKDAMSVEKKDALDLPPVTDQFHNVALSKKEERAYREMEKKAVILTATSTHISPNALTQHLRLRQLTSGFLTSEDEAGVEVFGSSKYKYALDLLRDLVSAGEKVVVFAHFRRDVLHFSEMASKGLSCPVAHIYGDTPNTERRAIRKKFLNHEGPMVVVAQMRTVSLAINEFVVASQGIYLSMSERRDDYIQSRDRLNRRGQERPVTFHHLVVPDTIDEAIYKSHKSKGDLEHHIIEYLKKAANRE